MQTFTGTEYLKIDVSNCFGNGRVSWKQRIKWVDQNEPNLEILAKHAQYPILYRKAVRALRVAQQGDPTNHIMGLDATASGLQIMAALSGCYKSAEATNLLDTGVRRDIYQEITDHMNLHEGVFVTRSQVKQPVMTVFYGSTAQPKKVFGVGKTLSAFYDALKAKLAGPYELMDLLQSQWNSYATEHQWTLPDGHVARVPVTQTVEKSIEIDEADHLRFMYRCKVIAPVIRSRSLAANIVHSLDGWIVRQMVQAADKQGFWLAPIHDCFYTSPQYMNNVRENYLIIMAWLANNNQVEKILSEIKGQRVFYRPHSMTLGRYIHKADYALS